MEQSLFFDGKEYVSSKRASEISKYTKDYVGQLCRGNKLKARLVGRNWYVDLGSLRTHMDDSSSRPKDTASVQDFLKKDIAMVGVTEKTKKTSFFVNHLKKKHIPVIKKDPQLAWREVDHKREQEKLFTDLDVAYEKGTPIFFNDEQPLYPTPIKSSQVDSVARKDEVSVQKENITKTSDTTIFFKADLVSDTHHKKPILSPIQPRVAVRQKHGKRGKSLDSIVPTSRPLSVHSRTVHVRKKTYAKAYGLVLIVLGTALLAGSLFMTFRDVGSVHYTAEVYKAIGTH